MTTILGKQSQYKPRPDSGVSPAPDTMSPEFVQAYTDYVKQFHCSIKFNRPTLSERMAMYKWCTCLGVKYKDWFIYEGGTQQPYWVIHIRSPKKATFFRLKWNDIIIESVDFNP